MTIFNKVGKATLLAAITLGSASAGISFEGYTKMNIPELTKLENFQLIDYNGDGLLDLLSGNFDGQIAVRYNEGKDTAHQFSKKHLLFSKNNGKNQLLDVPHC